MKNLLLFSDAGYSSKSGYEMITSGIAASIENQKKSFAWIRKESLDENCVESLADHDADIKSYIIEFLRIQFIISSFLNIPQKNRLNINYFCMNL